MGIWTKIVDTFFGPPKKRAENNYNLGMKQMEKGNLQVAEFHFKAASSLDPDSATYLTAYANLLLTKGDLESAIEYYENASAIEDSSPLLLSNWGAALRMSGNLEKAVELHRKAASLAPQDIETQMNAFAALSSIEAHDEARSLLDNVLKLEPEHPNANFQLARVKGFKEDPEEYEKCLDHAAKDDSFRRTVNLMRGNLLIHNGSHDEASKLLLDALADEPSLCDEIEEDEEYEFIRDASFYKEYLQNKPKQMYTCLTEATAQDDSSGQQKHLVVLSYAITAKEAKKIAEEFLPKAGWKDFEFSQILPAHKEGLAGMGAAASEGWEQAQTDGAHIFVF